VPEMTIARIFNLLCLFGNVRRVSIISPFFNILNFQVKYNSTGAKSWFTVMMYSTGDKLRVVQKLPTALTLFGKQVSVISSTHVFVLPEFNKTMPNHSHINPSPTYIEYTDNPKNRFPVDPRHHPPVYPPSSTLRFSGLTANVDEQELSGVCFPKYSILNQIIVFFRSSPGIFSLFEKAFSSTEALRISSARAQFNSKARRRQLKRLCSTIICK
jgi:hypothetical protein